MKSPSRRLVKWRVDMERDLAENGARPEDVVDLTAEWSSVERAQRAAGRAPQPAEQSSAGD